MIWPRVRPSLSILPPACTTVPAALALLYAFVQALLEKEIITAGETTGAACVIDPAALADGFVLTVDEFTEVQDLILADPVHDVDVEQGWPILEE